VAIEVPGVAALAEEVRRVVEAARQRGDAEIVAELAGEFIEVVVQAAGGARIEIADHAGLPGEARDLALDAAIEVHLDGGFVSVLEVQVRGPEAGIDADARIEHQAVVDRALDGRVLVGLRDAAIEIVGAE
ncbi:Uncharacterized protein APZ42_005860, partial [Daphnia magna]